MIFSFATIKYVSAFSSFNEFKVGYFSGRGHSGEGSYDDGDGCGTVGNVMPREYDCDAMKTAERYGGERLDSVPELMDYLKSANGGGDYRKKVASAFIVQTMLGRNRDQANANGGINISSKDWADLEARINATSISWNEYYHTDYNTYMKPPSAESGVDVGLDDSG